MPLEMPRDKLFWAGTWEPEVAETVRRSCQPGFRCLDVGSYRGFFSAVMAQAGAVSVDAFEPNPANREAMQKLLELNPGLRIRFHPLAVGSQTGEIDFLLHQDGAMGKIQSSNFQTHQTSIGRLTVPMASLDNLSAQKKIPTPDFIKLDVEGAELLVLQGAKELLRKTHPVWLIECHTPTLAVQCAEFLRDSGYGSLRILEADCEYTPKVAPALPDICHLLARSRDMQE